MAHRQATFGAWQHVIQALSLSTAVCAAVSPRLEYRLPEAGTGLSCGHQLGAVDPCPHERSAAVTMLVRNVLRQNRSIRSVAPDNGGAHATQPPCASSF